MLALLSSTQTLIYLGIALASFVAVAGTFLFGDHGDMAGEHGLRGQGSRFSSPE